MPPRYTELYPGGHPVPPPPAYTSVAPSQFLYPGSGGSGEGDGGSGPGGDNMIGDGSSTRDGCSDGSARGVARINDTADTDGMGATFALQEMTSLGGNENYDQRSGEINDAAVDNDHDGGGGGGSVGSSVSMSGSIRVNSRVGETVQETTCMATNVQEVSRVDDASSTVEPQESHVI